MLSLVIVKRTIILVALLHLDCLGTGSLAVEFAIKPIKNTSLNIFQRKGSSSQCRYIPEHPQSFIHAYYAKLEYQPTENTS